MALELRAQRARARQRPPVSAVECRTTAILPPHTAPVSSKRMLDGALGTDARARRARLGGGARLWVGNLPMGSHFSEGGARRGTPEARSWGVGRGAQIPLREHRCTAPRVLTVPNELTNECLWGGSAPPNGSRLSCGRPARGRKGGGRTPCPAPGTTLRFLLDGQRPPA